VAYAQTVPPGERAPYNNPVPRLGLQRRVPSFWPLQIGAWALYGLATAISYIPLRNMRGAVVYKAALLCTTFLASFVVHASCRFLWRRSFRLASALVVSVLLSYVLGVGCTVVSALLSLHAEHSKVPLSWSLVAAEAFDSTIVLIAWSALYFGIKHYGTVEEQRGRLVASEATAREAQLQALRYQLQPHFLFNTLNAISSLVVSRQPDLATEMIARLAALLRNTLSFPETHVVTLREELAVTEEYLSIEQVRFGPRLAVSLSVTAKAYEAEVPRFFLQPIVENAIRHGIARCPHGGELAIRASAVDTQLHIEIENDRSQSTQQAAEEGDRLGLANTRTRLETLYGAKGSLTVSTSQKDRFLVSIQFPLTTLRVEP
jgi:LytS/YehU family sensor histidine kinase